MATLESTPKACQNRYNPILERRTVISGSVGWIKRGSRTSHTSLWRMPLDSMEPHPTTKKTPAKIDLGMVESTVRRGPVMVPMIARPMTKWETRCSTTEVATMYGSTCSLSSYESRFNFVSYSVRESVCTGACGTRPLGKGMKKIALMNVVTPRRKKSQWKPPGFFRGNCFACAVMLLTFCIVLEMLVI